MNTSTSSTTAFSRRALITGLMAIAAGAFVPAAHAAPPAILGTFVTPTRSGTITFTPLRAFRGGVEGRFVVAGKAYPGSTYSAVGGGLGMVWYFGTSGLMAGNAVTTANGDGTSTGPVVFFNRAGDTIDSGTATVR